MLLRNAAERAALSCGSGQRKVQLVILLRQAIWQVESMGKARTELLESLVEAACLHTLVRSAAGLNTRHTVVKSLWCGLVRASTDLKRSSFSAEAHGRSTMQSFHQSMPGYPQQKGATFIYPGGFLQEALVSGLSVSALHSFYVISKIILGSHTQSLLLLFILQVLSQTTIPSSRWHCLFLSESSQGVLPLGHPPCSHNAQSVTLREDIPGRTDCVVQKGWSRKRNPQEGGMISEAWTVKSVSHGCTDQRQAMLSCGSHPFLYSHWSQMTFSWCFFCCRSFAVFCSFFSCSNNFLCSLVISAFISPI